MFGEQNSTHLGSLLFQTVNTTNKYTLQHLQLTVLSNNQYMLLKKAGDIGALISKSVQSTKFHMNNYVK